MCTLVRLWQRYDDRVLEVGRDVACGPDFVVVPMQYLHTTFRYRVRAAASHKQRGPRPGPGAGFFFALLIAASSSCSTNGSLSSADIGFVLPQLTRK